MIFGPRFPHRLFLVLTVMVLTRWESSTWANPTVGTLQQEQRFKDYTVRIYRDEDDNSTNVGMGSLVILKANQQVYSRSGNKFDFGDIFNEENTNNLPRIGQARADDIKEMELRAYLAKKYGVEFKPMPKPDTDSHAN